ncbi:MAG: D-hexose-6-phosphate mutarotase [Planctomycetota bacterium]
MRNLAERLDHADRQHGATAMNVLPDGVARVQDPGGRDALRLDGPGGRILVALLGAQVLSWQGPHGEVLFTGAKADYLPGKPVRGGIPLVFPWFGDHPTDRKLPAHGFARSQTWRLAAARPGPEVVLETTDDASTHALWPHAFRLAFTVSASAPVRLQLTIENRGSAPFRCEQALHTYFAVRDIHTASVHGLQGVPHVETAKAPEAAWDTKAPLRFRAETDRVFSGTPDRLELRAPALRRAVTLTTRGARSAIVWNPWPEKCARLSGLAADDWQRFCCIESANVKADGLTLAPGACHTLALALGCDAT